MNYELLGIKMNFEEYNTLIAEQENGKELVVENGKVIARKHEPTQKEIAQQRIAELKQKLADTDYEAIKFGEGVMTEAEYAPYKADRQKWRAEINDLERKLQNL